MEVTSLPLVVLLHRLLAVVTVELAVVVEAMAEPHAKVVTELMVVAAEEQEVVLLVDTEQVLLDQAVVLEEFTEVEAQAAVVVELPTFPILPLVLAEQKGLELTETEALAVTVVNQNPTVKLETTELLEKTQHL